MAAQTRKKSTAKRSGTGRRRMTAKERQAQERARKQMWAVVLFALGILFCAFSLIRGSSLWLVLHEAMFGLFGFAGWLVGPVLLYLAIITTLDRPIPAIIAKSWQLALLLLLISGALQIVGAGMPLAQDFSGSVMELYETGVALEGGGVMGGILGVPIFALFERTGGTIVILLLIFVFVMIITGSTLIGLYHTASKPVKKLEEVCTEKAEQYQQKRAEHQKPRFNIDVPMDMNEPPAEEPSRSRGRRTREEPAEQERIPMPGPLYMQSDPGPLKRPEPPKPAPQPEPQPAPAEAEIPQVPDLTPSVSQPEPAPEPVPETEPSVSEPAPAVEAAPAPQPDKNAYIDEIIRKMVAKQSAAASTPSAEHGEDSAVVSGTTEDHQETMEGQENEEKAYAFPPITLLNEPQHDTDGENTPEELRANAQRLVDTLQSFGVQTRIIDICRGPAVTRYELQPSAGVKISKITGLADDIALNLAAAGVRIEAPIPNKAAVGIEVPNKKTRTVTLREIIDSNNFVDAPSKLTVAMGRDIGGAITIADISKMPHMLIAGATGSGKSVCINSIIMSLLYKSSDEEVKFLMIDPKVVELGIYNGIPHLLVPVVTDPKKAAGALNWAVQEMLKRYQIFADNSVRDLSAYNLLAQESDTLQPMPQIVIIIDELSDLMMAAPSEVEDAICRLAQMARAAGMHLVIATQRPSVDVITGVIKANIPSRVAFAVSSQVDSRTILDSGGAEKLLGRGDMLFYPVGAPKPIRVQGCFVSDKEVERVVTFIKEGQKHQYDQQIIEEIERHVPAEKGSHSSDGGGFDESDEMLPAAIESVIETGQASTSFLQRRLKLGYARAGRLIDQMEQMGIVGPFEGSKPRQVLISKERWYEMKMNNTPDPN